MTTAEVNAASVFADARRMQRSSLDLMAAGSVRDASEMAWMAVTSATNALVLTRTGEAPADLKDSSRKLRELGITDLSLRALATRNSMFRVVLHDECFLSGMCDPIESVVSLIRETAEYIRDAERLAEIALSRQEGNDSSPSRKV